MECEMWVYGGDAAEYEYLRCPKDLGDNVHFCSLVWAEKDHMKKV